jgi:hypothetical protein
MRAIWASAPLDLQNLKLYLIDLTGLGRDALHVYAGLAVFLTVRLLWRWRGGWVIAWLAALALASSIEWLDMRAEGQAGVLQPDPAHWHDVWNTMVWPTVLLLIGRWLHPRPKALDKPSGDLADQPLHHAEEQAPPV